MKAIFSEVLHGINRNKLQMMIFAVGCTFTCALLLASIILSYLLFPSFDESYEKLNAPNSCVTLSATEISKEQMSEFLSSRKYIQKYSIKKRYLLSHVVTPNETMEFAFLASSDGIPVTEGKVIVNKGTHCNIGDIIDVEINGSEYHYIVDNLETDVLNSVPEAMVPYFFMNDSELVRLMPDSVSSDWVIEMYVNSDFSEHFLHDYEAFFNSSFEGELISYPDIRRSFIFRYEVFSAFFLFLSVFFMLIILLLTIFFSQMSIRAETKRIGILKACGFSNIDIHLIYSSRFMVISLLSSMAGLLLSGTIHQNWLSGIFKNIDRNYFRISHLFLWEGLILVAFNIFMFLILLVSIERALRIQPLSAITNNHPRTATCLFNVKITIPAPLSFRLGFQKCISRLPETLFIAILSIGSSVLLLTSVYIMDSAIHIYDYLVDWGIVRMDVYVSRVSGIDEHESGLLKALEDDSSVDFYYAGMTDYIAYQTEGKPYTGSVLGEIYDKKIPDKLDFMFVNGRNPINTDEVAIGLTFAKQNEVGIGDYINIIRNGNIKKLEVVGIYPSFKQYANSIRIITDDIVGFFENSANGYYSIVLIEGVNAYQFSSKWSEKYPDFAFHPMQKSAIHSIKIVFPPLIGCILLTMIFYMLVLLCIKKLMCNELAAELNIYHNVGFTEKMIIKIIHWRFIIVIIIGFIVAVPLSIYVIPDLLHSLAETIGLERIPMHPHAIIVLLSALVLLICSRIALISKSIHH